MLIYPINCEKLTHFSRENKKNTLTLSIEIVETTTLLDIGDNVVTGDSNCNGIQSSTDCVAFVTDAPTNVPTVTASDVPSSEPSFVPSNYPTVTASDFPSLEPTSTPSSSPSSKPTSAPSDFPTVTPSGAPSLEPSIGPSGSPTEIPSVNPSSEPTFVPSSSPSLKPTSAPSLSPSSKPTVSPTLSTLPSLQPSLSAEPSLYPSTSSNPSSLPSFEPSYSPSTSMSPSAEPTFIPSISNEPSISTFPSLAPSSYRSTTWFKDIVSRLNGGCTPLPENIPACTSVSSWENLRDIMEQEEDVVIFCPFQVVKTNSTDPPITLKREATFLCATNNQCVISGGGTYKLNQ